MVDVCGINLYTYGGRDAGHGAVGRRWANTSVSLVHSVNPEVLESRMGVRSRGNSQGSDNSYGAHV